MLFHTGKLIWLVVFVVEPINVIARESKGTVIVKPLH